ncbi:MAG: hypothetical protein JNK50_10045 [Bacteroidia bacterium]|nr:hypothetical protein [Bacteroidia bacterium]
MKNLKTLLVVAIIGLSLNSNAQFSRWWYQFSAKMRQTPWVVGGGWNVVDDDGRPFKSLFDVNKSWNIPPYPSRLFCQKVLDKEQGWSVELGVAYNRYAGGNRINNNDVISAGQMYIGVDAAAIYDFNKLYDLNALMFKDQEIFQPYAHMGLGYTYRAHGPYFHTASLNLGLGFNVWVYEGWGIQVQSVSKIALAGPFIKTGANYMQHSIGVAYKFQPAPISLGKRYKFKKHEIKKAL